MSKYRNARDLLFKIMYDNPDCEEIFDTKHEWSLSEEEFNALEEFEKVINSNQNNESFLYSFISYLYKSMRIENNKLKEI